MAVSHVSVNEASSLGPIALYAPDWPPGATPNGILTYVANLRRALQLRGVDSVVFTLNAEHAGDEVYAVDLDPSSKPAQLARRIHRRLHPSADFVRLGWELSRRLSALHRERGLRLFEIEESFGLVDRVTAPGVLRVVRLHGPWFLNAAALGIKEDLEFEWRVREEGRGIARADAVSAPSQDVLDRVRRRYGLELPHAVVLPNPAADIARERCWSSASASAKRILFVGRFDRHKGGDVMLRAFARVFERHPDAELVFAGPDRGLLDESGRRWTAPEFMAEHVPAAAQARIRMLGHTRPEQVEQLRVQAAVTVVPSRYETFAMTAAEAFAFGCPLIGSDVGGIAEIISHEKTGLLFRTGDHEHLAAQLLRLLEDPNLAQALAVAGRADYERRFRPDVVAEQTLQFYQSAIADKRPDARAGVSSLLGLAASVAGRTSRGKR